MNIRKAKMQDLDEITAIEAECFPASEAATRKSFEGRLAVYPDYFWILEEKGKDGNKKNKLLKQAYDEKNIKF